MIKTRRLMITFLALLCLGLLTAGALAAEPALDGAEEVDSGNCGADGDNLTWTLYDDGRLVISGTGDMKDFSYSSRAPWFLKRENILSAEIESGVTGIGENAFYWCYSMTSVTIPSSVKSIRESAFQSCDVLTSVTIPSGVTSIEPCVFENCDALTSVKIPSTVTSIGASAFYGCGSLESIDIPSSVTSIGYQAFCDCGSLTGVKIPSSVTSLGEKAFYGCDSLTSVTIPASVTEIEKETFFSCDELTSVTISSGVTSIGESAFAKCCNLTSVSIPSSVTSFESRVFENCDALSSVNIPSGVTSIPEYMFDGCYALTGVTIPEGVTSIGYSAFSWCNSLKSIDIPSSVTRIGTSAFSNCDALTSVTIPKGVTSIESDTFYGCDNLAEVTIPVSVTSIGRDAFDRCYALKDIYYAGTEEQWAAVNIAETNIEALEKITVHGAGGSSFAGAVVPVDRIEPTVELQDVSTDPGSYSFNAGHGSGNLTAQWKYAAGQAYAMESYFTIATGENSGDHTIHVTFNSGAAKNYVFEAEAYSVYFLTYTYSFTSSYGSGSSTVTVSGPGGEKEQKVSASGGTLKSGGLKIVLVAQNEPEPTPVPTETPAPTATPAPTETPEPTTTPEPPELPAQISLKGAKVTVKKQTYTGEPLTPDPTVKLDGKTLKKGRDYTVSYKKNTAAGIATVVVTGKGDYIGTAKGTFKILTGKTAIKTIKNVSTGVKLTWKKVTGAKGYEISRKEAGGKWKSLGTVTKASFTDTTAQAGVKYAYRVRCVTKDDATPVSGYSKSKTITFVAPPTLKSAKNVKSGIKVTWTESAGASKYAVYRKAAGGSWEPLGVTKKTAYTDKNAESGVKYAYKVCCVKKDGTTAMSAYSGTKAVTRK